MNCKKILYCLALLCFCFSSVQAQTTECSGSNVIANPQPFNWTFHPVTEGNPDPYYSGTLEMSEATFTIGGESLTTRAYGQAGSAPTIPAPTLNMEPGKKYVLRFHNQLPFEELSTDENVLKDPNVSNLHTHGLHISGETPSDDVTRFFEGGFGGDFVYDIPADHMGGTYWYHAHHHGSTFLQVSGGAFGMIVIDDSGDGIPDNVAAMDERHLVVAFLDTDVAGAGGDTLLQGTLDPTWTVNGKVNGNLCVPPDTWQHWRILLADRDAKEKTVAVGSGCEVALMARDGVWRTQAPKELATNEMSITGASRADLAVRCATDSSLTVNGSSVATIRLDGTAGDGTAHPYAADGVSTWSATRPDYLRDLRGVSSVNAETVRLGARTVNGSKFDKDVPTMTLSATDVQEWTLKGASNHPFHLHVYHMQTLNCGSDYEDGEYYDTIASNCDVRFDLNEMTTSAYSGRTIMHCHILEHEDQGAMGWLDVVGGNPPPTFPDDADFTGRPYSDYYSLSDPTEPPAAPSNLTATAASSSSIDLAWADNSTAEDGFGIERALGGSGSFAQVGEVGIDTTTFTDTGLSSDTTYDYRVFAFNSAGDSAFSNIASATTDASSSTSSVHVGSIQVSSENIGSGLKIGVAIVEVVDDLGNPVADAVVGGEFSGTFNETVSASDPTDQTGTTRIETTSSAKGNISVTFCVTSITHPTLNDFTAQPGEVCASN